MDYKDEIDYATRTPAAPVPASTGPEVRPLDRAAQTGQPELFSHAVDETSVRVAWPDGSVRLYVAARELDVEAERRKLDAARKWIASAQHGENCFLHDEGEYDRCFCGKDALEAYLDSDSEAAPVSTEQAGDAWQPIETAPKGAHGYAWMMLMWGDEDDPNTGVGMRWGDRFFAAPTFYALGKEKQYEFREIEVFPTHWMEKP